MNTEKEFKTQLEKELYALNFDKQMLFGLSCIERTKDLYANIYEKEIINNPTEYDKQFLGNGVNLDKIYSNVLQHFISNKKLSKGEFEQYIQQCFDFAPNLEEDNELVHHIAIHTCLLFSDILNYYISEDQEVIMNYYSNLMELINMIGSENFYSQYPDASDKACDNYLSELFMAEIKKELYVIELLRQNVDWIIISEFNQKNKIMS